MKKIYGNYVGIVINKDDPENRGRVQVFIPHLSNTLYKSWNDEDKDKIFKHILNGENTVFTADVLERLKKILPWAECASPIFGGGTSFTNIGRTPTPLTSSVESSPEVRIS